MTGNDGIFVIECDGIIGRHVYVWLWWRGRMKNEKSE